MITRGQPWLSSRIHAISGISYKYICLSESCEPWSLVRSLEALPCLRFVLHKSLFTLAFIGCMGSKYRKRNCPKCGLSMGASQNIRVGGWDRASQVNQLNLREWVVRTRTRTGRIYNQPRIEPFYLCRNCDLEFRLADLEQREATQK